MDIDYVHGERGSGAFGKVYEATWKGVRVAAKCLHQIFFDRSVVPSDIADVMIAEFSGECGLLARLPHPNIVQIYGVFLTDSPRRAPVVMVTELLHETLRARVLRQPRLTIKEALNHALEIATALRFLHEREEPIGHRDLSSTNVMLTSDGKCKLVDLGLAKIFTQAARLARTMKPGHEYYMPGEVLSAVASYDERLDVFSLGVIILEMLISREPHPQGRWLTRQDSGQLRLIPEVERRADDLDQLGRDHPVYPLIVRMFEPQATRPVIGRVFTRLQDLLESDGVARIVAAEQRASRAAERAEEERQVTELRQEVQQLRTDMQQGGGSGAALTAQQTSLVEQTIDGRSQLFTQMQQSQLDLQRRLLDEQSQHSQQLWQMQQTQVENGQQARQQVQQLMQAFHDQQRQQLATFHEGVTAQLQSHVQQVEARLLAERRENQRRTDQLLADIRATLQGNPDK